jgi:transmembrane sensor
MGGGALAASLGAVAWLSKPSLVRPVLLRTAKGEIRLLPLSDGSSVTLNTNSVLKVAYSASRRDVDLMSGEALFDVAKDRQRPFIVRAGDTRVRAVGTSFSVRLEETGAVRVLVREGVVEVTRGGRTVPVRAGANVLAEVPPSSGGDGVSTRMVGAEATARGLAWRDGMLSFNGESLTEAAAEFDRYSNIRIVVDDPDLGRQTLTGLFAASDPQGFAKAVASALNGKVDQTGNEVHIYR